MAAVGAVDGAVVDHASPVPDSTDERRFVPSLFVRQVDDPHVPWQLYVFNPPAVVLPQPLLPPSPPSQTYTSVSSASSFAPATAALRSNSVHVQSELLSAGYRPGAKSLS